MNFRGAPLSVAIALIACRPVATTMPANARRTLHILTLRPSGYTMRELRSTTGLTHKALRLALEHLIYVAHAAELIRTADGIFLYRLVTPTRS